MDVDGMDIVCHHFAVAVAAAAVAVHVALQRLLISPVIMSVLINVRDFAAL